MILSKKLCGFLIICTLTATVTLTAAHIFAGSTTVFCFSRGIIYASNGSDFEKAAGKAAQELKDQINALR